MLELLKMIFKKYSFIMKLTIISDTHNRHEDVILPKGEVLIHAGDFTGRGTRAECVSFLKWFAKQNFKYKILIAGNHDFFFEKNEKEEIQEILPKNIHYLNNSSITIEGVNFYGSPITPFFHNWAFNRERGKEIKQYWDEISDNTDVLITHGPPFGILDKTVRGEKVGCEELLLAVKRIKPKFHIFGHIHEDYGIVEKNETTFINASLLNERYYYVNDFVKVDI